MLGGEGRGDAGETHFSRKLCPTGQDIARDMPTVSTL